MPESVSSVDAILDRLRGRQLHPRPGQIEPRVYLADAVAAVHAAADARTAEIARPWAVEPPKPAASPDERLREAETDT